MNAIVWKFFGAFFVAGFLASCSDDSLANGGIWDETQNTLAVRVLTASGAPAENARVRLVTGTASVEDSAYSDAAGIARLKRPSKNGFVEIEKRSGVARENIRVDDSLLVGTLQSPKEMRGSLSLGTGTFPQRLYLYGTSYAADVSASGDFAFRGIPAGEYAVLAKSDGEYVYWGTSNVSSDSAVKVSLSEPSFDSVLVEDFEVASGTNLFHALTGASWWFTSADSLSRVEPSLPANAYVRSSESFLESQSAHFSFTVDSSAGAYALCGFDIGVSQWQDSTTSYDMSKTDSVTFSIRGAGLIVMQFAGFDEEGNIGRWDFEFDIPSATEWKRVSIPPKGNEDWEKIKSRMRTVTFLSTEDADLWLDQIMFHGISAQDLFRDLLIR